MTTKELCDKINAKYNRPICQLGLKPDKEVKDQKIWELEKTVENLNKRVEYLEELLLINF